MKRHTIPNFPLMPLQRISPSRFIAMKLCSLKGVWESSNDPLLPKNPAARLGSVIHKILELSTKGRIDIEKFDEHWREQIVKAELEIAQIWQEEQFVPLSTSVINFDVKSAIYKNQAKGMLYKTVTRRQGSGRFKSEFWVKSPDGNIAGTIDLVRKNNDGIQILDYKTGLITSSDGTVTKEYQDQLKMYAALYFSQCGTWPNRLTIIGLNQVEVDIAFTHTECMDILNTAKQLLDSINNKIIAGCTPDSLANPTPESCRYCHFRPACFLYWLYRDNTKIWPTDLRGKIVRKQLLGNGLVRIIVNDSLGEMSVRGLSTVRHKFLNEDINQVMLCNLKREKSSNSFVQSQYTTGFIGL